MLTLIFSLLTASSVGSIVDGYTSKMSAYPGDSVDLFLNASTNGRYELSLYDLAGNKRHHSMVHVYPQAPSGDKPYEDGFGYKMTKRIAVPELPSGVYLWDNQIPFVIKSKKAEITVLYPSNTVNAYNASGGKSLYGFNSSDKAPSQKVSFLRPSSLPKHAEAFFVWMHQLALPGVGYITDVDMEDFNAIKSSRLLIVPGHSEYWTLQARRNFDKFISMGRNAMVLSGNTMWWQVRYNKARTQMICYRNAEDDPIKKNFLKTINWHDSTLRYPIVSSIGADFSHAGYGLKQDKGWDGYKIITNSPLLEGTGLRMGDTLQLLSDETDGVPINGFTEGIPLINYGILGGAKCEIIGFDHVWRGGQDGVATWIVFRPSNSSGTIINTASTDWCSHRGIGKNVKIRTITRNMIVRLLGNQPVFSDESITSVPN